jgi:hypothetical protein
VGRAAQRLRQPPDDHFDEADPQPPAASRSPPPARSGPRLPATLPSAAHRSWPRSAPASRRPPPRGSSSVRGDHKSGLIRPPGVAAPLGACRCVPD